MGCVFGFAGIGKLHQLNLNGYTKKPVRSSENKLELQVAVSVFTVENVNITR